MLVDRQELVKILERWAGRVRLGAEAGEIVDTAEELRGKFLGLDNFRLGRRAPGRVLAVLRQLGGPKGGGVGSRPWQEGQEFMWVCGNGLLVKKRVGAT